MRNDVPIFSTLANPVINAMHVMLVSLFRLDMLQWTWFMQEVVRISLRYESPFVRLLHIVLVALLLRESDGVLFRLELDVCALHSIC